MTERQQFASGAVRSAHVAGEQMARFDLVSPIGLRRLAETCHQGAVRYSPNNWRRGIPASSLLNHALAHIVAYLGGDRSEDHMSHAAWNLFAVMEFEETRPELIDVPFDLAKEAPASLVEP
jgi:hypothetical protein